MINADDIDELGPHHRDVMLDLVLAWASLDVALGMMLCRLLNVPMPQGAELVKDVPSHARFEHMRKLLLTNPTGAEAAGKLRKYKRSYEKHSKVRNLLAHSRCAGVWRRDPQYVVFATFAKVDADSLAVDAVPLEEMKHAITWGQAMTKLALDIVDSKTEHVGNDAASS